LIEGGQWIPTQAVLRRLAKALNVETRLFLSALPQTNIRPRQTRGQQQS